MNYSKLFEMQKELDSKIVEGKGLEGQDLLTFKVEALLCEIQECANEQRSWKFWSENKIPRTEIFVDCNLCHGTGDMNYEMVWEEAEGNGGHEYIECESCKGSGSEGPKNPLLEETVDVLHFILSIGNDLNINHQLVEDTPVRAYDDITEQFIALSYTASCIAMWSDKQLYYLESIKLFKGLVHLLGFTEEQLEEAYYIKNKTNHQRQATNY